MHKQNEYEEWRRKQKREEEMKGGREMVGQNGGGPDSHIPAHASITTVAPFRAWRGSRSSVAGGPTGPPQTTHFAVELDGRSIAYRAARTITSTRPPDKS